MYWNMCPQLVISKLYFHKTSHLKTFFTNCIFGKCITTIRVQNNIGCALKTIQNQIHFFGKKIGVYSLP